MGTEKSTRVFIGSGQASWVERQTLIHSLLRHTPNADISVFNGTHNTLERAGEPPRFLDLVPLALKYQSATEFSLYRFAIPELCQYQGRAIYLDSDVIALADVETLFALPMHEHGALALPLVEGARNLGVMLFDCAAFRISLKTIAADIERGRYSLAEVMRLTDRFVAQHQPRLCVGELPAVWNALDRFDAQTKVLHYTELRTQPWRHSDHPYGAPWFDAFFSAYEAGRISKRDLKNAYARGNVRRDLLRGNHPPLLRPFGRAITRRLQAKWAFLRPRNPKRR